MAETLSPHVDSGSLPEAVGPVELEEALRRARAPIIKEAFAEPWTGDQSGLDPWQAGWEQAAENVLAKIQKMQSSGLVQLTPEGLTPKQAEAKTDESAKLAEANARAEELAEQLRRAAEREPLRPPDKTPEPLPRERWDQLPDSPPPAEAEEPATESEEEEVEEQIKKGLDTWLEKVPWKRIALEGATVIPPMVFGGVLGYLDPETARNVSVVTGSAGIGLALTSMAAAMAERILPAHVRVGLLGRALVAAKVGGLYGGNALLSTAIGTHVGAAIRGGVEALQAAQQAAAQMGQPEVFGATGAGGGNIGGDYYHGVSDVNLPQSQVEQPPAEQVEPPKFTLEQAGWIDQIGHPELVEAQQREAAELAANQAAEAARQAALEALNSGKTIGELAQTSGQVSWNVVRGMAGDSPHAGEVTNVVTRALEAGGEDIANLHEGAISQLVTKVQGFFDSADNALQTFNVGHPYAPRPYDAGGLGAVETVKGLNSPEAQAIRAGNLADMEAAGNLFNNVLKPVLSP